MHQQTLPTPVLGPQAAHRVATTAPPPDAGSPFAVLADAVEHAAAVERFVADPAPVAVPVWTGGSAGLTRAAGRAAALYDEVDRPAPCTHGVLLDPAPLPAGVAALLAPLATTWIDVHELAEVLDRPETRSLVIAGCYEHFTVEQLWPVLRVAAGRPEVRLSFVTGRDAASLGWFAAKQYVRVRPGVERLGMVTATDRGIGGDGVRVLDERAVNSTDLRAELLGTSWRRLLLQGHGKDDSLNLADYTVCGRNASAPRDATRQGPICAYQETCYKPVDKLIGLDEIQAVELVLSSCNNAPFADAAVYDPKFQLMLNAVDGPAQHVVAAVSVHDSDRAENDAWLAAVRAGASSVAALNAANGEIQPFPAYVQFGVREAGTATAEATVLDPDPLLLAAAARLTAYLGGGLLSAGHRLRPRLGKLAVKVEEQVSRRARATQDAATAIRSLRDDLQSLDQAIASHLVQDPDSELSNYPAHFGSRTWLDRETLTHVRCQCGRPAERFVRRALVPTVLDLEGVICLRCGDVSFRLPDGPAVLLQIEQDEVPQGGSLRVRAAIRHARPGAVRLCLNVAKYGRDDCTVTKELLKVKIGADGEGAGEFTVAVSPRAAAQAYYVTVYAVQDLAVTTARRHFGVVTAPGVAVHPLPDAAVSGALSGPAEVSARGVHDNAPDADVAAPARQ